MVVGALDVDAEAREPVGVVAQHGSIGAPVEVERGLLHEVEEAIEFVALQLDATGLALLETHELEPGRVDRLPHLGGQRDADRAGVGARESDAIADRREIVAREGEILDDVGLVDRAAGLQEALGSPGRFQRAVPLGAVRRVAARTVGAWEPGKAAASPG